MATIPRYGKQQGLPGHDQRNPLRGRAIPAGQAAGPHPPEREGEAP